MGVHPLACLSACATFSLHDSRPRRPDALDVAPLCATHPCPHRHSPPSSSILCVCPLPHSSFLPPSLLLYYTMPFFLVLGFTLVFNARCLFSFLFSLLTWFFLWFLIPFSGLYCRICLSTCPLLRVTPTYSFPTLLATPSSRLYYRLCGLLYISFFFLSSFRFGSWGLGGAGSSFLPWYAGQGSGL
ncbi:hypothetical protein C8R44DRAFT_238052 [Mycena epipterygia]|nr:hypothetical protein C8R44DRAFT_238052 [Mycena epipterygia]